MLEAYLQDVRERLARLVASEPGQADIILQPLLGEGKLIRPRLVLLASGMLGGISESALDVAAAVECIHTASLVHDDIIDQADTRRGFPTANSLWGTRAAILLGDHYFASAFYLLTFNNLPMVLREVCQAIRDMCQGEMRQDARLFDTTQNENDYYASIYGKTASLFAAACRCGGLVGGAKEDELNFLGWFGENLGYAFQLADDISDLTGSREELGKPAGGDLINGVITLPVIFALNRGQGDRLRRLIELRLWSGSALQEALELVRYSGGLEYAAAAAVARVEAARTYLSCLPDNPFRAELLRICRKVLHYPGLAALQNRGLPQDGEGCRWEANPHFPGYTTT